MAVVTTYHKYTIVMTRRKDPKYIQWQWMASVYDGIRGMMDTILYETDAECGATAIGRCMLWLTDGGQDVVVSIKGPKS